MNSTALDSSVTSTPACVAACSAACSVPMRNICGVWASHLQLRLSVLATRPPTSVFSVSASGSASSPPTASRQQAASKRVIWAGVIRQRAASCTSTQSVGPAPLANKASRPFCTLWTRLAPPQCATANAAAPVGAKNVSPGATTTSVRVTAGTAANAASVCITNGWPATSSYCLGWAVAARLPLPAHAIRANTWKLGASACTIVIDSS